MTQECGKCDRLLPDEAFTVDNSREEGRCRYCKECVKKYRSSPKAGGEALKTADMAAYMREYMRNYYRKKTEADPEAVRADRRKNYEEKMRKLRGPDWVPTVKLTQEELTARRKERNNRKKYEVQKVDPEARMKMLARRLVANHIKLGKLVPWPCEICGEKAEAHHPSYDRPLLVVWLCKTHHWEAHAVTKE